MRNSIRSLYRLGFAIHWLRPNSKVPLESKWTEGPRKSLSELEDSYSEQKNVGVRLGKPSKLTCGNYLFALDCDVKSSQPRHRVEMEKFLESKISGDAPTVISGRGNGSKHVYMTSKVPIVGRELAKSKDVVKVNMPSVLPNSTEKKALTSAELADGIRLRAAWEVCALGTGRQTVLPPSIHPDSQKPYTWLVQPENSESFPLAPDSLIKEITNLSRPTFEKNLLTSLNCSIEDTDIYELGLKRETIELIVAGEGCIDRSASLFSVALTMVNKGIPDPKILSILTNKNFYLGKVGFERQKTSDRLKAAKWVNDYTLIKARKTIELSSNNEINSWKKQLELTSPNSGAIPKPKFKNCYLLIKNELPERLIGRNDFTHSDYWLVNGPWGSKKGDELKDSDILSFKYWLSVTHKMEPHNKLIEEAIAKIGLENNYHPIVDYLKTLKWDGRERIGSWLKDYLGASAPEPYLSSISRKTLIAMVARVLSPGSKFDHVLILEGPQGVGKSTAVRILASPWFTDAHFEIGDKDSIQIMQGSWVVELGELSSLRKADINLLKEFISRPVDRIRLPYGRLAQDFPRQCIFIGTTNSSEYLKDTSGNRRFWPVKVKICKTKELERDRDQLLAEALLNYQLGERPFLSDTETQSQANEQQDQRIQDDLLEFCETVLSNDFIKKHKSGFSMTEFIQNLQAKVPNNFRYSPQKIGDCLRKLGFEKVRIQSREGKNLVWRKSK